MKIFREILEWIGIIIGSLGVFIIIILLIFIFNLKNCSLGIEEPSNEEIENIISKHLLRRGLIKCTIPDTMKVGFSNRVIVQIKHGVQDRITRKYEEDLFFRGLGVEGRKKVMNYIDTYSSIDSIKISSYVEVNLIDPKKKFILNPLFDKKMKIVDSLSYSTWQWEVEPKKSGKYPLIVNVSTRIYDGYESNFDELKVYEKEILIQSNKSKSVAEFFSTYWQWLCGTLIIPMFLWLRKEHLKKRNKGEVRNPIGFKTNNEKEGSK